MVETSIVELPTHFKAQWVRLLAAIGGEKDADLARALSITSGSISQAKKAETVPPAWIIKISREYGISADWLLYGVGKPGLKIPGILSEPHPDSDLVCKLWEQRPPDVRRMHEGKSTGEIKDSMLLLVPKVRARLSHKADGLEVAHEVTGHYAFRRDWLARKGPYEKMVLMDISGDFMFPRIENGDTVLIDQSKRSVVPGCIYAIGIDNEVVVRIVDKKPGKLLLVSMNKEAYPAIEIEQKAESVQILGEIIWWCHEK